MMGNQISETTTAPTQSAGIDATRNNVAGVKR